MGLVQDTVKRLGKTKPFATINKRIAPRIDLFVHRLTGGRTVLANRMVPTLVLVHRGRKTGREIRTPLSYIRERDGFVLTASNWGQPHHPSWSGNLLANPDAFVEVGGERIAVRARRVSAEEKARLWPRLLEIWPAYDTYQERSGRDIRVFVLERVSR